ncbi:MAG TPA: hypothetical protein VKU35_03900, partial [Candidatus Limnocylindria bacterium]|nr:hypothetical protein [Candidatus Limnocylindria bacterium]
MVVVELIASERVALTMPTSTMRRRAFDLAARRRIGQPMASRAPMNAIEPRIPASMRRWSQKLSTV